MPVAKDFIPVLPHLNFYPRTNRSLLRFSVMFLHTRLLHKHLICNRFSEDFPEEEYTVCSYLCYLWITSHCPANTNLLFFLGTVRRQPAKRDDRCVVFVRTAFW